MFRPFTKDHKVSRFLMELTYDALCYRHVQAGGSVDLGKTVVCSVPDRQHQLTGRFAKGKPGGPLLKKCPAATGS